MFSIIHTPGTGSLCARNGIWLSSDESAVDVTLFVPYMVS
jgi:hypothetical protein